MSATTADRTFEVSLMTVAGAMVTIEMVEARDFADARSSALADYPGAAIFAIVPADDEGPGEDDEFFAAPSREEEVFEAVVECLRALDHLEDLLEVDALRAERVAAHGFRAWARTMGVRA